MFDVAIIGCGIVGAAAAYELSRYQLSVVVLEKENDVANGTTKANSAILHAGFDPEPGTLMAELNVQGAALAKELCRKLDVPYRACGSLVLAFSEEEQKQLQILYERGLKNKVPGLELKNARETLALEPNLSKEVYGALHAPSAAIVSPWEYCLALAETAAKNGVSIRLRSRVEGIEKLEEGYRLSTASGSVEARFVLNAAGLYADAVHNLAAPPSFRIIPDRGEYYLLDKNEGNRVGHVIFQCPTKVGKGTLVAPTVHGNLIVGPNNEPPADTEDMAVTREGLAQIARLAHKSVPSVNLRESIRNFAGIRAACDRDDFVLEQAAPGFFDLAGIKSPGLTAAPAIAKYAAGMLREAGLDLREKEVFVDSRKRIRFQELSQEEKIALVRENPAYGRIVCRCETVTEGEILDAMRSPLPPETIDAVKRRVGAGMGRCQGGFCGPRVAELLCRERGIDPLALLQDRDGGYLLTDETKGGRAHV